MPRAEWVIAGLSCATAARASNAAIAVTNSAGLSDPAAGVPRVFAISGEADRPVPIAGRLDRRGLDPITPRFGEPATITVYRRSEAPARVFAKIRTADVACATSFGQDPSLRDEGRRRLLGAGLDGPGDGGSAPAGARGPAPSCRPLRR